MICFVQTRATYKPSFLIFLFLAISACFTERIPTKERTEDDSTLVLSGFNRTMINGREVPIGTPNVPAPSAPLFTPTLTGPIQSIDVTNGQIVVLGKTIQIDSNTIVTDQRLTFYSQNGISTTDANKLFIGDKVQVSFLSGIEPGIVLATELNRLRSPILLSAQNLVAIASSDDDMDDLEEDEEFELVGVVNAVDFDAMTLIVEDITVDISMAEDLDELMALDLLDQIVEVEGVLEGDLLIAEEVELENDEDEDTLVM